MTSRFFGTVNDFLHSYIIGTNGVEWTWKTFKFTTGYT